MKRPSSLRGRIVLLVLVAIAAVLLPLAGLTYLFTMSEVDELFDARLAENAKTLAALDVGAADVATGFVSSVASKRASGVAGHPYESQIGFQVWQADGQLRVTSDNFRSLSLAPDATLGYADARVDGRRWRLFTWRPGDGRTLRTGERYDSRREIARALAAEASVPLLIAFPLLALLVGIAVHRGLQPLRTLTAVLSERPVEATEPVPIDGSARELQPVVQSLNGLLERLAKALADERAFTTNAAHELRTPLAGALIHLENASQIEEPLQARAAMAQAHESLDRLRRLVAQLLDLARWDCAGAPPMSAVDLRHCINEELAEAGMGLADRNIELIWPASREPVWIMGWAPGVRTLVRNLLDNAIRHSPPEGRIGLHLLPDSDGVLFSIEDQGPGIPEHERTNVLRRFRRGPFDGPGAGVGLALVARIAEVHRATLLLREGRAGWGLRVDVRFEAVNPASAFARITAVRVETSK